MIDDGRLLQIFDAAETDVGRAGLYVPFASGADHVASAVLAAAEKGSAAVDTFDDSGLLGVPTADRALWVLNDFAQLLSIAIGVGVVKILTPLPDIAGHIE